MLKDSCVSVERNKREAPSTTRMRKSNRIAATSLDSREVLMREAMRTSPELVLDSEEKLRRPSMRRTKNRLRLRRLIK